MNKTSKVKAVQGNGTFEFNGKTFYKFDVEMENGDLGAYNSIKAEQNKFVVGEEVEYTFTGGQYPKIKPVYTQPNSSGGFKTNLDRELKIIKQSCLKASVELCTAGEIKLKDVIKTAEKFVNWVNGSDEGFVSVPKKETTNLPF